LAVASGDEPAAELREHLADCSSCRGRLERFQAEVSLLRREGPQAVPTASTASGPSCDPATANGQANDVDCPAPGPAAETTETKTSESETELGSSCEPGATGAANLPAAIGKYLVIGGFPRTGQAEVFRVVHPGLARDLVLKLALTPIRPDGRCEIIEEGKILAGLKHPHLVQVYDQDFHEDRPYLVMEYIRGRTLEQIASEGGLKPRQAAALLAKVAGAADYAHRHGIVHRDIKPKNILVDESGEPRLIDFGMARLRHAWSDDPVKPGGTFAFMAPEQARVESPEEQEKVGPRSDVFALGAVLYYLLTGAVPFPGQSWRESMARARECDFDREALDDPRVARALARICLKAMAADPADRFATAEEMGRALERARQRPFWREAFAMILILGALSALLGFWKFGNRTAPPNGTEPAAIPTLIEIHRGSRVLDDLSGALPLVTGDRLRIVCDVPHGLEATAFWLDAHGQLEELSPLAVLGGDRADRLVYPRPERGKDVVALKGSAGTDLLLVCARRSRKIERAEVGTALATGQPLPDVPEQTFMTLSNDEVRVRSRRGLGAPEMSSVAEVRDRLEAIRRRLGGRCDFVAGLAVPHRSPTAAHDSEAAEDPN
jgi:hypothetical protein